MGIGILDLLALTGQDYSAATWWRRFTGNGIRRLDGEERFRYTIPSIENKTDIIEIEI